MSYWAQLADWRGLAPDFSFPYFSPVCLLFLLLQLFFLRTGKNCRSCTRETPILDVGGSREHDFPGNPSPGLPRVLPKQNGQEDHLPAGCGKGNASPTLCFHLLGTRSRLSLMSPFEQPGASRPLGSPGLGDREGTMLAVCGPPTCSVPDAAHSSSSYAPLLTHTPARTHLQLAHTPAHTHPCSHASPARTHPCSRALPSSLKKKKKFCLFERKSARDSKRAQDREDWQGAHHRALSRAPDTD